MNKTKIYSTLLFSIIFLIYPLTCNEQFFEIAKDMDNYTKQKQEQWEFNPYEQRNTDKNFNTWTDPLAYNSYWYMYYPPFEDKAFDKNIFKKDKVLFYHSPQLGASISPIAFQMENMKYRFYIGVGFLWNGYFLMYKNGGTQYYGTHLFLNSVIQVEPYIDFIYKDNLKIRLTPVRHICYHMSGDILGDSFLYNKDEEKFRDVGFEQIHASVNYRWGWFNFYSGLAAAITNFSQSNYVNILYFYGGSQFKFPIYGHLNLIAGLHLGLNYDRINDIQRIVENNKYICLNSRYETSPVISAGVGVGIYNWVIGLKFDYARARQIYAYDYMDLRIGLSACLLI